MGFSDSIGKTVLKGADIKAIRRALLAWYRTGHRALPWRNTGDPYRIWVSEVMLQQTQVATVIPYYQKFLQSFPDVDSLARADLQAVLKAWEGLGYYARARHLHRAAKEVTTGCGGRIPADPKALLRLPGIGDYIAAALMSIAFGRPYAVVDGNVKRVLSRLFAMDTPVNGPGAHTLFGSRARQLLDPARPGDFNQALMELGAMICRPKHPDCTSCPLAPFCKAWAGRRVNAYPKRRPRNKVPQYAVAIGVVFRKDRILILQRKTEGFLGGLWEFPGGKIQSGESPQEACRREVREEASLEVLVERHLARIRHGYTHFRIEADVFLCRHVAGRVRKKGHTAHRWIRPRDLDRFPFPGANRKFIPLIKAMDH